MEGAAAAGVAERATIAEAVLQAGLRYEAQVAPRVRRILREHPGATTSARFLAALGDDPAAMVGIRGRKAGSARALAGGESIAVDVRVRGFLAAVGVATGGYDDAAAVVAGAAAILGLAPSALDARMWRYAGGGG